jgi:hypothetical protein
MEPYSDLPPKKGKIFLEELVRMGEKIKEDLAKKSNCNNN